MMRAKIKTTAVMLTILLVLLCFTVENIKIAHPQSTGGNIDLFTQKEPYSGKGPNIASDMFGLDEEVQIYARVTYNEWPVQNLLVAFGIMGPKNPVENITFFRTAITNSTGIAKIEFRIPNMVGESVFGEWKVVGVVSIAEQTFQDIVKFKVGWIIEIEDLKIIREDYSEQIIFPKKSYVGIKAVLKNNAFTEKAVTLTVTIYDSLNVPVNATELKDFIVEPNGTLVPVYFFLYIPETAEVGNAKVYLQACTKPIELGGVPYCPEFSKSFVITGIKYFLNVKTEPAGLIEISGQGWYEEYTSVNLTAPKYVYVSPNLRYRFDHWDVDGVSYAIGKNSITIFMDMNHTATAHYTQIFTLTVTATTGGTTTPTPGTYEYQVNTTVQVKAIPEANYVFDHWELDGVNVGSDNPYVVLMDGDHTLKAVFSPAVAGWFIPEWFYWLLFLLILFLIALMGILLYRRRRKKFKEAFSSGWTAWYYGYNLRNKDRKF